MLKVVLYEDRILSSKFGVLFVFPFLMLFCIISIYNYLKEKSLLSILPLIATLFYFIISLIMIGIKQLFW